MLFKTFKGTIYNQNEEVLDPVKYQAYYKGINGTVWSDERLTENGQYSINLGDSDWLGLNGYIADGDLVVICFWTPTGESRNSSNLEVWGCFEVDLQEDTDIYVQDATLSHPMAPYMQNVISGDVVNTNIELNNAEATDNHSWFYNGKQIRQDNNYFDINVLPNECIEIDWGDGSSHEFMNPNEVTTHQYSEAGDYEIRIWIINKISQLREYTKNIRIYWEAPVVDFQLSTYSADPNESISATNETSDPNGRAITDDWKFYWTLEDFSSSDITTWEDKDINFSFDFICDVPGSKQMTLECHWWNGFEYKVKDNIRTFTQEVWEVNLDLTWNDPITLDRRARFSPQISGDTHSIIEVNYYMDGQLTKEDIHYSDDFYHTFSTPENHKILQEVTYNNGYEEITKTREYTIFIRPLAMFNTIEAEDGCGAKFESKSTPGKPPIQNYIWEVYHASELQTRVEGPDRDSYYYSWPFTGLFVVYLTIEDDNGLQSTASANIEITECPKETMSTPAPYITPPAQEGDDFTITVIDVEDEDL